MASKIDRALAPEGMLVKISEFESVETEWPYLLIKTLD
jgi:hypothetical protein